MKSMIDQTCSFKSEEQAAAYYAFVEGIRDKGEAMIVGGVDEVLEASKGKLVFFGEIKETIFSFVGEGSGVLYTTVKNLGNFYDEIVKIQSANPKVKFIVLAGDEEKEYTVCAIFAKELD